MLLCQCTEFSTPKAIEQGVDARRVADTDIYPYKTEPLNMTEFLRVSVTIPLHQNGYKSSI
jgi:hypothetical protein